MSRKRKRQCRRKEEFHVAHGWSSIVSGRKFHKMVNEYFSELPAEFFNQNENENEMDCSDLIVKKGEDLCENYIENCIKDYKEKKTSSKISKPHVDFAKKFPIPRFGELEKTFQKLRKRREGKKMINSKLEVNKMTRLRKEHLLSKHENLELENPSTMQIIFSVCIFNSNGSALANRLDREVLFLHNHTLEHLQKQVVCLTDLSDIQKKKKRKYEKSSFFVIEGDVYTDNEAGAREFQEICANHWQKEGVEFPEVKALKGMLLVDVPFRLGATYYYIHHGNCVHPFCFRELRVSTQRDIIDDPKLPTIYPLVVYEQVKRRQKCGICQEMIAEHTTYNDIHVDETPFYWCERCFMSFHFDQSGKQLYDEFEWKQYKHD